VHVGPACAGPSPHAPHGVDVVHLVHDRRHADLTGPTDVCLECARHNPGKTVDGRVRLPPVVPRVCERGHSLRGGRNQDRWRRAA
jgi:hypothetical protein